MYIYNFLARNFVNLLLTAVFTSSNRNVCFGIIISFGIWFVFSDGESLTSKKLKVNGSDASVHWYFKE